MQLTRGYNHVLLILQANYADVDRSSRMEMVRTRDTVSHHSARCLNSLSGVCFLCIVHVTAGEDQLEEQQNET